jgi:hypothetical protein
MRLHRSPKIGTLIRVDVLSSADVNTALCISRGLVEERRVGGVLRDCASVGKDMGRIERHSTAPLCDHDLYRNDVNGNGGGRVG